MRDYSLGIRAEKYLLLFFQSGIPYVVFWVSPSQPRSVPRYRLMCRADGHHGMVCRPLERFGRAQRGPLRPRHPSAERILPHRYRRTSRPCVPLDMAADSPSQGLYTTAILALTALSSTSARRLSTASDDHPLARVRMSASVGPAGVHRLEYDKDGGMDEEDMKYGAGLVL